MVTHPSTNPAQPGLTSVIGREPVYSRWYGRRRKNALAIWPFIRVFPSPDPQARSVWPMSRGTRLADSLPASRDQCCLVTSWRAHCHRGLGKRSTTCTRGTSRTGSLHSQESVLLLGLLAKISCFGTRLGSLVQKSSPALIRHFYTTTQRNRFVLFLFFWIFVAHATR